MWVEVTFSFFARCVNVGPEEANWNFRWSMPQVRYDPGDVPVEMPGGTKVSVEDKRYRCNDLHMQIE